MSTFPACILVSNKPSRRGWAGRSFVPCRSKRAPPFSTGRTPTLIGSRSTPRSIRRGGRLEPLRLAWRHSATCQRPVLQTSRCATHDHARVDRGHVGVTARSDHGAVSRSSHRGDRQGSCFAGTDRGARSQSPHGRSPFVFARTRQPYQRDVRLEQPTPGPNTRTRSRGREQSLQVLQNDGRRDAPAVSNDLRLRR